MYRIFLAEDDFSLAEAIQKQLESWGNEVRLAKDFRRITEEFAEYGPQLVIMDIMLPFFNGYHWCGEIRKISSVPVVFLSSASDNMNIVMAINMGADDFLAKPVDPMVLTAKVQAILRRTYEIGESAPIAAFHGAVLNLNDCSVTLGSERVELTKNEFRILQTLLEKKGEIVSRELLMTRLWQSDLYVADNTLTVNVNRLRKKLEQLGLTDLIVTKPQEGYLLQ